MSLFSHADPTPEPDPDAPDGTRIVGTVGVHGGGLAGVLADGRLGDVMLGSLGQDGTYETEVELDPAADPALRAVLAALAQRAAEQGQPTHPGQRSDGRAQPTTASLEVDGDDVAVLLGRMRVGTLPPAAAPVWREVLTDLADRGARHVFAAALLAEHGAADGAAPGTTPALRLGLDLVADDEYADDVLVDARDILGDVDPDGRGADPDGGPTGPPVLDDPLSELGGS